MSWFTTIPVAFACLALLFLPGSVLLIAAGLRRPLFIAVAPVLTVTVVSISGMLAPYAGISWSIIPVALATCVLAVGLFLIRKLPHLARPESDRQALPRYPFRTRVYAWTGFLVGAGSIAVQLRAAFGHPDNISQTFDDVFHLNAVRFILDTGNASSLTLTAMTNGDNPPYFYPAAWHDLVSLLVQLTAAPLPVAVNIMNMVVAAFVWTLGCMFLVSSIVGANATTLGCAGVLAAGFGSFPILLLDFGVLYPNFLSISLLPAALACVNLFFGTSKLRVTGPVARYSLAPLATIGVAIAHPNGFMSLIVLSLPVIVAAFVSLAMNRRRLGRPPALTISYGVGLVVLLAIFGILWKYVRPPAEAAGWPPIQTPGQAIGEVLTNSAMQRPPAWVVSILLALGLVYVLKRPQLRWIAASFVLVAAFFVVVSAGPVGKTRDFLTGVWYNDSYRLAALLPISAVALAAIGGARLSQLLPQLLAWLGRKPAIRKMSTKRALHRAGIPIFLVLLGVLQAPSMVAPVKSAQATYALSPNSPLVSSDEMTLLKEIDNLVPPDATLAVNPWTGGAMAFALADRNTTSKHTLTTYSKATELLNAKFRDAATDPTVCAAARSANVRYVLDFGTREVHGGSHDFQGLQLSDSTPGFTLVAEQGEAKLFEVTACG